MTKIDDVLEKMTADSETKKWKVAVGIIVGLLIPFVIYFGVLFISEPVINEYLTEVSPHPAATLYAYSIYDNQSANYSDSVFFMGSSIVGAGFKIPKIYPYLNNSSFNYVDIYNLQMPMDTPLMRSLEMQKIIDAKPSLVIFGITYRDVMDVTWHNDRTVLVYDHLNVRNDSLYLYNSNELHDINAAPNPDYKKTYLLSAWNNKLGLSLIQASPKLSLDGLRNQANTSSYLVWHPEITNESTRYKEALLYNVNTLLGAGIDVVIVNMPISPILSNLISDSTRQNYFDLLNETGANWYNMETDYGYDFFNDLMHASEYGSDLFAPVVADLIIQELS